MVPVHQSPSFFVTWMTSPTLNVKSSDSALWYVYSATARSNVNCSFPLTLQSHSVTSLHRSVTQSTPADRNPCFDTNSDLQRRALGLKSVCCKKRHERLNWDLLKMRKTKLLYVRIEAKVREWNYNLGYSYFIALSNKNKKWQIYFLNLRCALHGCRCSRGCCWGCCWTNSFDERLWKPTSLQNSEAFKYRIAWCCNKTHQGETIGIL